MNLKRWVVGSALLLLLLAAAGCGGRESQQGSSGYVMMALDPQSLTVGPTVLLITLTDAVGDPVNDANLTVRGDMVHAGMMPVLAEPAASGVAGVYTVPFDWTMGGDWVITVEAELKDGSTAKREFDVTIEG